MEHLALEDREAVSDGLGMFVRVENAGWKGVDGTATGLACQPDARRFYGAVLGEFARRDGGRIDVLTIDGMAAAAQLAIRCGDTWNLLKVGFDETFSSCGPGSILLKMFLEQMTDDPEIREVSLVTAPPWANERWHMPVEPTYDITVFAPSLRGRARLAAHDAHAFGRRIRARARRISR